jgi:hypothetical protein
MTLTDFYNAVSREADTAGTAITVAETKRVLAMASAVLAELDAADCAAVPAKGRVAAKRKKGR